ncbi:hypothetical protein ACFOSD_07630 [Salinispirillum marinum]|uniref:Scaffold protein FimL second domain-containing protein n=2 Tax=Saccharospirillaceae TaxID=255527 RepID=A0ABV8BGV8_9GAMM
MANSATFLALKTELTKTVEEAQRSLEQYLSYSHSLQDWQSTVDAFQQLRGIFIMLEHQGASLLCEESVHLMQFLPVDRLEGQEQAYDVITRTLVILQKYLEFQELNKAPLPEILLPMLNELRRARNASLLREGCFHRFRFEPTNDAPTVFALSDEGRGSLRTYRHMFQAGLLYALREQQPRRALKYMALALTRVQKQMLDTPLQSFWELAALAAEGLASQELTTLSAVRRRWYGQLDRELRKLISGEVPELTATPINALVQDSLYFIALSADASPACMTFQQQHPHIALPYSARHLAEQRELLTAPGTSVLHSVSLALHEEFMKVQDMVDSAARPEGAFSAHTLRDHLVRVADTLEMVGLMSPANVIRRMWTMVKDWPDNIAAQHEDLMTIANAVLYAESALDRLTKKGIRDSAADEATGARSVMLESAQAAVLDETEAGLTVAKRAITAYMENDHDSMHLANVPSTLSGIRGALMFLQAADAVMIVEQCMRFVVGLQNNHIRVTNDQLEAFADALSSLELYLESLLNGQDNPDLLRMARASVVQLPSRLKGA